MPMAVLIGYFLSTIALTFWEKQFLYRLGNTKEFTFVHPVQTDEVSKRNVQAPEDIIPRFCSLET